MAETTGKAVGFVGIGNMGFPMAARLVDGGFAVSVHDIAVVTALAEPAATVAPAAPPPNPSEPTDEPAHRRAARYAWALLLARIYEVFPFLCPECASDYACSS